jgi:hypothetical protein
MEFNGTSAAILLGVWATFALDVFGSMNSSPQTTEINAGRRADTLMKWVYMADAMAIGGGAVASVISKKLWPILGTAAISLLFTILYMHAKKSGLESGGLGTEDY